MLLALNGGAVVGPKIVVPVGLAVDRVGKGKINFGRGGAYVHAVIPNFIAILVGVGGSAVTAAPRVRCERSIAGFYGFPAVGAVHHFHGFGRSDVFDHHAAGQLVAVSGLGGAKPYRVNVGANQVGANIGGDRIVLTVVVIPEGLAVDFVFQSVFDGPYTVGGGALIGVIRVAAGPHFAAVAGGFARCFAL